MTPKEKMTLCYRLGTVADAARTLVTEGVLRPEDFAKSVRVWVKKHPEINDALPQMMNDRAIEILGDEMDKAQKAQSSH